MSRRGTFVSDAELPRAVSPSDLLRLYGSTTQSLGKFRQMLKAALDDLVAAGFLLSFRVTPERVEVQLRSDASRRNALPGPAR